MAERALLVAVLAGTLSFVNGTDAFLLHDLLQGVVSVTSAYVAVRYFLTWLRER